MNTHFLTVIRQKSMPVIKPDWTLSELQNIQGVRLCRGVEDEVRNTKVFGEMAIPAGVYPLAMCHSPRFSPEYFTKDGVHLITRKEYLALKDKSGYDPNGHPVIWIQNVPGFGDIRLHWGNTDDDTEGCYVVGRNFAQFGTQQGVDASRDTYVALYPLIVGAIRQGGKLIEYRNAA